MFWGISFNIIAQESSETVKDVDGNVYNTVSGGVFSSYIFYK